MEVEFRVASRYNWAHRQSGAEAVLLQTLVETIQILCFVRLHDAKIALCLVSSTGLVCDADIEEV